MRARVSEAHPGPLNPSNLPVAATRLPGLPSSRNRCKRYPGSRKSRTAPGSLQRREIPDRATRVRDDEKTKWLLPVDLRTQIHEPTVDPDRNDRIEGEVAEEVVCIRRCIRQVVEQIVGPSRYLPLRSYPVPQLRVERPFGAAALLG